MPYRMRRVVSGKVVEEEKYYSYKIPSGGEKRKRLDKGEKSERQKKANARAAGDRIRWLMNGNFKNGDRSLTLSYRKGEEPESIEALKKDAQAFTRKLRKLYGGETLKYIYVLGAGKHRKHVHILLNKVPGVDVSAIEELWGRGRIQDSPVYTENQMGDLADYYLKNSLSTRAQQEEAEEKPGRYYYASRTLIQPTVVKKTINRARYRKSVNEKAWNRKGYYLDKESSGKRCYTDAFGREHYGYTFIKNDDYKNIHNDGQEKHGEGSGGSKGQDRRRSGRAVPRSGS